MSEGQPEGQPHRPYDTRFREALQAAVMACQGREEGAEIRFLCPAHDDHHPSARYNPEKGVWCCDVCGTGGGALDLARRLGIEPPERQSSGLTVEKLAKAKGLPAEFLHELGVTDGWAGYASNRKSCVDISYVNAYGEVKAVRKRLRLDGEPRFKWRRGDKPLPYGLWRLREARAHGYLIIVEGESDCWTLWHAGIPALGIPGAATWREGWVAYLEGIGRVLVWREPGQGGDTFTAKVVASLPDAAIIEAVPA